MHSGCARPRLTWPRNISRRNGVRASDSRVGKRDLSSVLTSIRLGNRKLETCRHSSRAFQFRLSTLPIIILGMAGKSAYPQATLRGSFNTTYLSWAEGFFDMPSAFDPAISHFTEPPLADRSACERFVGMSRTQSLCQHMCERICVRGRSMRHLSYVTYDR